jgi:replicative DNA helicase
VATEPQPLTPEARKPPQNVEAERSVLGAMLLNPDAVGLAIEILGDNRGDMFYVESHRRLYSAMVELNRRKAPIDAVTLTDQLVREGHLDAVGGASYIAELTGAVPTSANVEHYAGIVAQHDMLRRLITSCTEVVSEAYDRPENPKDLLDRAEAHILRIAQARERNPITPIGELLDDAVDRIDQVIKSQSHYTGLPSGFRKLDETLSGFQPSDMIVLAARPSVGKTAFALNIAANLAIREGKSVLLFSLEMAKMQLTQRLLCMQGKINSRRLQTGYLARREFPKLTTAASQLQSAPIFIDDSAGINILELRSKTRRHLSQYDLDMVIIDYLQLMRGHSTHRAIRFENRQTEIAEISRSIKELARELGVPILALSQLNREADREEGGIPRLSQLRESGAIEQDADVVIMMSRPPLHRRGRQAGDAPVERDPILEKTIFINIAKQRNGPTGRFRLLFEKDIQRFEEPAPDGIGDEVAPPFDSAMSDYEDYPGGDVEEDVDEPDEDWP